MITMVSNRPAQGPTAGSGNLQLVESKVDGGAGANGNIGQPLPEEDSQWKAGKREWLIAGCLFLINTMVALDGTILVAVLPVIAESLHGNATEAFWTGTSYLLAAGVVQPPLAELSDIFGRRCILLFALISFTIGTIICALSRNFTEMLVGRSIQGVGGGGCLMMTPVLLSDIVPMRQRALFLCPILMAFAIPSVMGPYLGGVLTQNLSWRWCFYVNLPLCLFAIIVCAFSVKITTTRPEISIANKMRKLDWIGSSLFIISTCSFLAGITAAGSIRSWTSPTTIVLVVSGVLVFLGTLVWEGRFAPKPFFQLTVFTSSRGMNAAFLYTVTESLILGCVIYLLPLFFEVSRNHSPMKAGIDLLPIPAAMILGGAVACAGVVWKGRYCWAIWVGSIFAMLGQGLLILLYTESSATLHWNLALIVLGFGHGALGVSILLSIQASATAGQDCHTTASYTFLREVGLCLGVAVGGTVLQGSLSGYLRELGLPEEVAANAQAFVSVLHHMNPDSTEKQQFVSAYVQSFGRVFEMLAVIQGIGFLSALLIKDQPMNLRLVSDHFIKKGRQRGVQSNV